MDERILHLIDSIAPDRIGLDPSSVENLSSFTESFRLETVLRGMLYMEYHGCFSGFILVHEVFEARAAIGQDCLRQIYEQRPPSSRAESHVVKAILKVNKTTG